VTVAVAVAANLEALKFGQGEARLVVLGDTDIATISTLEISSTATS